MRFLAGLPLVILVPLSFGQTDTCTNPTAITGPGSWAFSNVGASVSQFDGGGPCNLWFSPDVFWTWTPAVSGDYVISTCGSPVNSRLKLHEGGDCSATCLFDFGFLCANGPGLVYPCTGLVAGQQYLIQVDTSNVGAGLGTLEIQPFGAPPINDTCSGALPIAGTGSFPFDRSFATTSGFGGAGGLCPVENQLSADVFHQWTATQPGDYVFRNCSGPLFHSMEIHAGLGCAATCEAGMNSMFCGVDESSVILEDVSAGDTFLIRQFGLSGALPEPNTPGVLTVEFAPPPLVNDECSAPSPIFGLGAFTWNNLNARPSEFDGGGGPCQVHPYGGVSGDVYYVWTSPFAGSFRFVANLIPGDAQMNLHSGSDCNATCIASDSELFPFADLDVTLSNLDAGEQVLIQIGSWRLNSGWGPGTFQISSTSSALLNVECSTTLPIWTPSVDAYVWSWNNNGVSSSGFDGGDPLGCPPLVVSPGVTQPVQHDVFFTWSPNDTQAYRIHTDGSVGVTDTRLDIHLGDDCSATCLASNDDIDATNPMSEVFLTASPSETYLIQVGTTTQGDEGTGSLWFERIDWPMSSGCQPAGVHHQGSSVLLNGSSFWTGNGSGLHIHATGGPVGAFGFLLGSPSSSSAAGLSNGILCLDLPIGRYTQKAANNLGNSELVSIGRFDSSGVFQNLSGTSTVGSGFDVPQQVPIGPTLLEIVPGDTWYFQLWYRDDPGTPATGANLSEMLIATF